VRTTAWSGPVATPAPPSGAKSDRRSHATTISKWENEFLAYFDHRVTNGRTEGRNRTIKHVKRIGYGYRHTANYILKCRYRALRVTSWTTPAKRAPAASNA
jgi:hypothetical protein